MNLPSPALAVTVAARTDVGDVVVLDLRPDAGSSLPAWAPGAHVDLLLPAGPNGAADGAIVRQFSLCGPLEADYWRVAVLWEADSRGGSAWVREHAQPGARLEVAGPRNHFEFVDPALDERSAAPVLFIAGGIGVTPLVPMAELAARAGRDYTFHLAGHDGRTPFLEELVAVHGDRLVTHLSGRDAPLDVTALLASAAPGTIVYCCGPARLLQQVEREAARRGLELHTERFEADELAAPVRAEEFEVEFALSGLTATVSPDRSVLAVAEEAGIFVLSSCQEGTCGTCETVVLEGEVDHRDSILTPGERESGDLMYVCVSRAAGPRLVLEL